MNNNTVTVFGTDINLSDTRVCKTFIYNVLVGSHSESIINIVKNSMLFQGHLKGPVEIEPKSMVGINHLGQFVIQTKIKDSEEQIVFCVPIENATVKPNEFMMGLLSKEAIVLSEVTQEQLSNTLSTHVYGEFQNYLNTLKEHLTPAA